MYLFAKLTFEHWNKKTEQSPQIYFHFLILAFGIQSWKLLHFIDSVCSLLEEILFLSSFIAYQESSPLPHHSRASLFIKIPDFGDGGFWWFSFSIHFLTRPKRTLYSKKYGVDLIRYTHAANTVVYSSNKIDGKRAFFLGSYGYGFLC